MEWYSTLDINTKINVKECFKLLFGVGFEELSFMFSFQERIDMSYNKLRMEGFNI